MFARTERLMLRPAWLEDAGMIAALVQSERKARDLFGSSTGCRFGQPCALDACTHSHGLPRLLVFRRTSGAPELIGMAGLGKNARNEARLFCWIARPHRRKGYGSEAARAVVRMARDSLRLRVLVAGEAAGGASGPLLARLGFRDGQLALGRRVEDMELQARAA